MFTYSAVYRAQDDDGAEDILLLEHRYKQYRADSRSAKQRQIAWIAIVGIAHGRNIRNVHNLSRG
jgi:hypothetical protein